ncbi:hypothetical protein DFP73DRAFT_598287 [Morchella snyderi]|nr:hypothetical protein DFP73DRAFT_598287 [Morchella snyderi]
MDKERFTSGYEYEQHTRVLYPREQAEAIEAPEVEEIVDTSHSEYDDSPENDHESFEENEGEPEDEPQASTQGALGYPRRRPTGAVAEVIASSDVSVDVVQVPLLAAH